MKSVENHWSKAAVNDMASRLVIGNPETFSPDATMSRAEFVEYLVKALGVFRTGVAVSGQFSDVDSTHAKADALTKAVEYGIIKGYPDGRFKPDQQITREEAMVMVERAMSIVKLIGINTTRINAYTDYAQVSPYAKEAAREPKVIPPEVGLRAVIGKNTDE